ncbi:MAG TPA: argininosuccinate lyase [Egibacteraceae bacterium]|nr:argininosuccinate lyase [Egibacteraceae bacterium]
MTVEGRLWGGRFAERPDAAAWELGRSVGFDVRLWPHDLAGSRAHADELRRIGVLSEEDHELIVWGLGQISKELAGGQFAFLDDDEDLHGAVERRLLELCGPAGGRLRAGRSRNDQIVSDLRLYLRDAIGRIVEGLRGVQAALADKAEEVVDWVAPGYTHLQRAQPVTLGHHLLAHAWALERDVQRMRDAAARMNVSVLGSGALAGLTLELDPARYAEALDFSAVADNSMDAVADRDFAVEFLAAAAIAGVHLSRLGEEVVLWSSAEFGWARVGDAFSTGSSIMPQKRNPDVAELIRGKSGRLVGDLVSLLVTLKGLPLTYNRDLQEDKEPVFDSVDTLSLALPAAAGMISSLRFDRDRLFSAAAGGFSLATDLAEELVRQGVPFREAHEHVGALVARCEQQGMDLSELSAGELSAALPRLGDAGADLLDAVAAVARRRASLGPSPEAVRDQLRRLRERLQERAAR